MSKNLKKKPKPKKAKKMDEKDDPWAGWPENLKFHNKPPEPIKRRKDEEKEEDEEK